MSDRLSHALARLEALQTGTGADPEAALMLAKCRGLVRGYDARWKDADFVPDSVEREHIERLVNPDTGSCGRKMRIAGKVDATGWAAGNWVVLDHKSTSEDIAPGSPYRAQLAVDAQAPMYMMLNAMGGRKPHGAIWDLMRKPSISPREAKGETLEQYGERLADDCTNVRPEWYFQRQAVIRPDSDLIEFAEDLWRQSKEILRARREKAWPRSPGACLNHHSPCTYLPLCAGHDSVDSGNWQTRATVHPELPGLGAGANNALTHSRVGCFQLCRRKHFYKYELGLERARDEGEGAALRFGTFWHLILEAWLKGGTQ